jgi:antitoxin component of MazEF toxin-antitoxin module
MRLDLGTRKIQAINGSAFVSLPRPWIQTYQLKKGDEVNIILQDDGTLKISCTDPPKGIGGERI